jgi:hypothetical protein
MEEPLRYETLTGLSNGQLAELAARITSRLADVVRPGGAPAAIGLFKSVAMVVTLMRKNLPGGRRGGLRLLPADGVAPLGPAAPGHRRGARQLRARPRAGGRERQHAASGWHRRPDLGLERDPDLYSGKAGYAGMNIQVAATQAGEVAAIARSRCTAPAMTRTSSPSPA